VSLPIGALTLKERFGSGDPLTQKEYDLMRERIGETLDGVDDFFFPDRRLMAVGTGGSVTTVAFMLRRERQYRSDRIHRTVLTAPHVVSLLQTVRPLTADAIRERYFLEPGKADIVLFGGVLLLEILLRIPGQRITVSDYGLLEGVALERGRWEITGKTVRMQRKKG